MGFDWFLRKIEINKLYFRMLSATVLNVFIWLTDRLIKELSKILIHFLFDNW